MKTRLILPLLLLFVIGCTKTPEYRYTLPTVTIEAPKQEIIYFTRNNLDLYSNASILAGVVNHECFDCLPEERHLVMESLWNRVINNYNQNGYNIISQLLAPKQFTGLFIYSPERFSFNPNNQHDLENFEMAKQIIDGQRIADKCIYYWAGKQCDMDTLHGKWLNKRKIKLKFKTKQIYG